MGWGARSQRAPAPRTSFRIPGARWCLPRRSFSQDPRLAPGQQPLHSPALEAPEGWSCLIQPGARQGARRFLGAPPPTLKPLGPPHPRPLSRTCVHPFTWSGGPQQSGSQTPQGCSRRPSPCSRGRRGPGAPEGGAMEGRATVSRDTLFRSARAHKRGAEPRLLPTRGTRGLTLPV